MSVYDRLRHHLLRLRNIEQKAVKALNDSNFLTDALNRRIIDYSRYLSEILLNYLQESYQLGAQEGAYHLELLIEKFKSLDRIPQSQPPGGSIFVRRINQQEAWAYFVDSVRNKAESYLKEIEIEVKRLQWSGHDFDSAMTSREIQQAENAILNYALKQAGWLCHQYREIGYFDGMEEKARQT